MNNIGAKPARKEIVDNEWNKKKMMIADLIR